METLEFIGLLIIGIPMLVLIGAHAFLLLMVVARGLGLVDDNDMKWLEEHM